MSAPPTNGHPAFAGGPLAPPQNLEAEQSVLGAVLLSDTALPALIIDERLQPEDFYRDSHARIYQAMLDLHTLGEPVDALTLVEHLKQAGELEAIGGAAAVEFLAGSVPAVGNVRQYARIVRDNAMLRRLPLPVPALGPLRAIAAGGLVDAGARRGTRTFAEWCRG